MRYDTPIEFRQVEKGLYNTATGDYGEDSHSGVTRYASVSDTGAETVKLVYGNLKQRSLTVQLQNPYDAKYDQILIKGRPYKVDFRRILRTKETLIVSEV